MVGIDRTHSVFLCSIVAVNS